jgi:NAD(P)-dependent dehydrogenase (short-subunit alcohol dehydrogenase family)
MDFGLEGKLAFVGGASRGIGKAIALELAREGADVVVASRSMPDLERAAAEIAEVTGRRAIPMSFDATQRDQVDRVINEAAQALGGLHILVNSASLPGGSPSATGPIEGLVDEDLINDFDVKFVGALRCARAAIPLLKEQGYGRIVNISGLNARNAGNLSGGARNVSMVHMTKTLATQLGQFGITVNCIHPGTTRTERTPSLLEARAAQLGVSPDEAEQRDFAPGSSRGNAICRMVDASEIGFLTAYLASDKAWAVTGEVIAAGGGVGSSVYY